MVTPIDRNERLFSIVESQKTLIQAQKDHILALQTAVKVLRARLATDETMTKSFESWRGA